MEPGGRVIVYGGEGNDQIYATDNALPVTIYGQGGHDQITGGSGDDVIDGGDGWDRIWAGPGDDLVFGGTGSDSIDGREGNDILLGGDGDDYLYGGAGLDVLIGNTGSDRIDGGDGDDLLIGGSTTFDNNAAALRSLLAEWALASVSRSTGNFRLTFNGQTTSPLDDGAKDVLIGGSGHDWVLIQALDQHYGSQPDDTLVVA
jgi:Ca2+-binding RTX toxin-like protein